MTETIKQPAKTLIMLKPDAVDQNLVLPLLMRLSNNNVDLANSNIQMVEFTKNNALEFYENAHKNRLAKYKNFIKENPTANKEELTSKLDSINEINDRNSNFISSGAVCCITIENKYGISDSDFYVFTRELIESFRPLYSSNHNVYGMACNAIHGSDNKKCFERETEIIANAVNNNRDLSKIYFAKEQPTEDKPVNAYHYYLHKMLKDNTVKMTGIDGVNQSSVRVMDFFSNVLDKYMTDPNISNALLLKNSVDFILHGANQEQYQLKNEKTANINEEFRKGLINDISRPELDGKFLRCIGLISSKVDGVIESTIGKNRDLYEQSEHNKNFSQKSSEIER